MPQLDIEQFDEAPSVGDTVTITGKVQEIKKGKVDISYDTIVTLPGSSENGVAPEVTLDQSLDKYMANQKMQGDNTATQ